MQAICHEYLLQDQKGLESSLVPRLVDLGESLGQPCTVLLEGRERVSERSYLGFGQGWIVSECQGLKAETSSDALVRIRKFIKEFTEDLQFMSLVEGDIQERESSEEETTAQTYVLQSGLTGYLDYEWGLAWQRPASSKAEPGYFFRACPINIVVLPAEGRLVLEIFAEDREQAATQFVVWRDSLEDLLSSPRWEGTDKSGGADKAAGIDKFRGTGKSAEIGKFGGTGKFGRAYKSEGAAGTGDEPNRLPNGKWSSNIAQGSFLASVEQIREYIKAGDVFQAVYSQRFSRAVQISEWELYHRLRDLNPSPYLFCLKGQDEILVGSSPELLVSTVGSRVRTRPIAGTRARGETEELDQANESELRRDPKENAEHAMLVDLGRNDIGRVARYGSVRVTQYSEVERFSHVMHLVSTVEGELQSEKDGLSALQAVFPAGTLSGAPKVRAMEILQELEPEPRGAYGGALGIIRWNGDVDFCITIRTLKIGQGQVSVQAGAGIVFDSVPEREYAETLHKAEVLMKVVDECVDRN